MFLFIEHIQLWRMYVLKHQNHCNQQQYNIYIFRHQIQEDVSISTLTLMKHRIIARSSIHFLCHQNNNFRPSCNWFRGNKETLRCTCFTHAPHNTTHVHTLFRLHIFLLWSYCWSTLKLCNSLPLIICNAWIHYEFMKFI